MPEIYNRERGLSDKGDLWPDLRPVVLGCAIALPGAAIVMFLLNAVKDTPTASFLRDWQDLIAGILALVGAFVGAFFLNRQTMLAQKLELEKMRRCHLAAKAAMPNALSEITDYCRAVVDALLEARHTEQAALDEEEHTGTTSDPAPIDLPSLPDQVIGDFRSIIEATGDVESQAFYELLVNLQIQNARLKPKPDRHLINNLYAKLRIQSIDSRLFEAVVIHASAGELFPYARNKPGSHPERPTWTTFEMSMRTLKLDGTHEGEGVERIRDRMLASKEPRPRL